MVHPELVPLGIGVVDVSRADALDPIQEARIVDRSAAQVGPILPPPARDDVVDRCGGVVLVVQVAVFHGNPSVQFGDRVDCTPPVGSQPMRNAVEDRSLRNSAAPTPSQSAANAGGKDKSASVSNAPSSSTRP